MKSPLNLGLPWQRVDQLMQPDRNFQGGEGLALIVEQLEVGDEPERVGHGDHPGLDLDPVPGDARGLLRGRVSPERLAGAR